VLIEGEPLGEQFINFIKRLLHIKEGAFAAFEHYPFQNNPGIGLEPYNNPPSAEVVHILFIFNNTTTRCNNNSTPSGNLFNSCLLNLSEIVLPLLFKNKRDCHALAFFY